MKWWIAGFLTLLIVLTFVVWWEQKSGGACYEQHATQNVENLVPSVGKEQESPQQTNGPASDSESYLCRLLIPANLPTDYLVLIGLGGVLAALGTLSAIKRQADLMESSLVSVQRAFVFAKNIEIGPRVVDAGTNQTTEWHFGIQWENSGMTPTKGLEIHVNFWSQPTPLPTGYPFPNLETTIIPFVLGPKGTTGTGPLRIPVQCLLRIQHGTQHAYLYGSATYRDIFKNTPKHVTKFCWTITGVSGNPASPTDNVMFQWAAHNEHNCADDECHGQKSA
jgi:hypothetical protein